MNFSQWFWKYGYLLIPLVLALGWFISSEKFQNLGDVNPAIFDFFAVVDQQCENETFDTRSANCLEIEKFKANCQRISSDCDSRSYYDLLVKLGYQAPAYLLSSE